MKQLISEETHVKNLIWKIDFSPIMFKLMATKDGKGWTRERADIAVEGYRRFLFLTVTREETIVPAQDIDEVWHAHILDTSKYREDCSNTFGFFLDHFPYFGMRSDADQDCLQDTFAVALDIERAVFGDVLAERLANGANCGTCGSNACGSCAHSGIHDEQATKCGVCCTMEHDSCAHDGAQLTASGGIQSNIRPQVDVR